MSETNKVTPFETQLRQSILDCLSSLENEHFSTSTWTVGLSGGVDSTVLLLALHQLKQSFANVALNAIYVNHGLSQKADEWANHCARFCDKLNVPLTIKHVSVSDKGGLEQAARHARWSAFEEELQDKALLFLGHHQDDQVETLLLRLLRGCGVYGASAMNRISHRPTFKVIRPMLNLAKQHIIEYAENKNIRWVEDESNQSVDIQRNYLRHSVLPLLKRQWKGVFGVLNRFTEHMQDTSYLLDELAASDLGDEKDKPFLTIEHLCRFDERRQQNMLRFWLRSKVAYLPSDAVLKEGLRQLNQSQSTSHVQFTWGKHSLRQSRGQLWFVETSSEIDEYNVPWDKRLTPKFLTTLNAKVIAQVHRGKGIRPPFSNEHVSVRSRKGGERCRPNGRGRTAPLKKIFQEMNVPDFKRDQYPLIFYNEELVAVVGLFYAKDFMVDEECEGIEFALTR